MTRPPRRAHGLGPAALVALALLAAACGRATGTDPSGAGDAGAATRNPSGVTAASTAVAGTVRGTVTDLATGAVLPGATVRSGDSADETDPNGGYVLALAPGVHDVRFEAEGYDGATVVGRLAALTGSVLDVGLPPLEPPDIAAATLAERARASLGALDPSDALAGAERDPGAVTAQAAADVTTTIRVWMPEGDIVAMETDEYLKGVVPAEMGYLFRRAAGALEAQAIAARTYAMTSCLPESAGDPSRCEPGLDANVDTTTRTQVWRPVHYDVSDAAVTATTGRVARHDGQMIHALYFARVGEKTLASESSPCCGGSRVPYLRPAFSPDPFAERRGHGAGMSQEGAAVLGDWGADAEEIVEHYYADVEVDPQAAAAAGAPERTAPETRHGVVELAVGDLDVPETGASDLEGIDRLSPPRRAEFRFMALAVGWSGGDSGAEAPALSLRVSPDGKRWGGWLPLATDEDGDAGSIEGSGWTQLHIVRGGWFQVGVSGESSTSDASGDLRLVVHYYDADRGPEASARAMADGEPAVISRAGWGADERLRYDASGAEIWPPEYSLPRAEILHHTVTATDPADPAAVVRAIYYYHAVTRGWGDVGYHYLVDHRGNIYEGRFGGERAGGIAVGAHVLGYNVNTMGIAMLGTFTSASSEPSPAAEAALVELMARRASRYGIRPHGAVSLAGRSYAASVMGHRDVLPGYTVCPGDGLHNRLPALRDAVAWRLDQLQAGATPSPTHTQRPLPAATRSATRTATRVPPSATPTNASTATPVPTGTVPPGCAELVRDGGFESAGGEWLFQRAGTTRWDVYRGSQAALLGLRDDEADVGATWSAAIQTLRVPDWAASARLSFVARTEGSEGDTRLVRLLDADGATAGLAGVSLPAQSAWNAYRFDVTPAFVALRARGARLYFGVANNGDGARSTVRLDDVSVVVCRAGATAGPATAAPTGTAVRPTSPASATPAASAKPAASATPAGSGELECVPIAVGGGFEGGTAGAWRTTGNHPAGLVRGGASGSEWALALGPTGPGADVFGFAAAYRDILLPASSVSASLRLSVRVESLSPGDAFRLEVRRTADGARLRLLTETQLGPPGSWRTLSASWDAGSLGSQAQLYAAVLNRGRGAADPAGSSVLIDDVEVEACLRPTTAWSFLPWGLAYRR